MKDKKQILEKAYSNFIEEAELFFVKPFLNNEKIKKEYSECLDIIYGITNEMDSSRGIIAQNPKYGQGKSFFFEVVNHRNLRTKGKYAFKWTTARELCDIYVSTDKNQDPLKRLNDFINVKNLFIDDIGDELRDAEIRHNYSNKINVLRYVLLRRYDLWVKNGYKTFGTTNLEINDIAEKYDGRLADRFLQMTYFKKFDFLENGSFRQMSESRRLTEKEIQQSFKKFEKPKKIEKINLKEYFNGLINESDAYLEGQCLAFWDFVMSYMVDCKIIQENAFKSINDLDLKKAEFVLRKEANENTNSNLKHAPNGTKRLAIKKIMKKINGNTVYQAAKTIIAKDKFMELRKNKHVF